MAARRASRAGRMKGRSDGTQGIVTIINMQQSIKERTLLAKEQQLQANTEKGPYWAMARGRVGGQEDSTVPSHSFAVRRLNDV